MVPGSPRSRRSVWRPQANVVNDGFGISACLHQFRRPPVGELVGSRREQKAAGDGSHLGAIDVVFAVHRQRGPMGAGLRPHPTWETA